MESFMIQDDDGLPVKGDVQPEVTQVLEVGFPEGGAKPTTSTSVNSQNFGFTGGSTSALSQTDDLSTSSGLDY